MEETRFGGAGLYTAAECGSARGNRKAKVVFGCDGYGCGHRAVIVIGGGGGAVIGDGDYDGVGASVQSHLAGRI